MSNAIIKNNEAIRLDDNFKKKFYNALVSLQIDPKFYDDLTPEEVLRFANHIGISDIKKLIQYLIYIYETQSGTSKFKAFTIAFPERCVRDEERSKHGRFQPGEITEDINKDPNRLSVQTINVKIRRLEQSKLFKRIYALMTQSLYVMFAIERVMVLQRAFNKAMSDDVKDMAQVQYMKIFLEETRKAEEAKAMEINVDVTANNINVSKIEQKMEEISDKLKGLSAEKIIEVMQGNK